MANPNPGDPPSPPADWGPEAAVAWERARRFAIETLQALREAPFFLHHDLAIASDPPPHPAVLVVRDDRPTEVRMTTDDVASWLERRFGEEQPEHAGHVLYWAGSPDSPAPTSFEGSGPPADPPHPTAPGPTDAETPTDHARAFAASLLEALRQPPIGLRHVLFVHEHPPPRGAENTVFVVRDDASAEVSFFEEEIAAWLARRHRETFPHLAPKVRWHADYWK